MSKCSFDGINKIISLQENVTFITLKEMYSEWKEWVLLDDNLKYLPAFSVIGGEPTVSGKYLGSTFFLENNWKIKPYSGNHTLIIEGNLYTKDGSSPMIQCDGNYNVLVNLTTSNLIDTIATNGSTIDENQIADAVRQNLTPELLKLLEMYTLMGLDPTKPLIVTKNSRNAGTISQNIVEDISGNVTVTRIQ